MSLFPVILRFKPSQFSSSNIAPTIESSELIPSQTASVPSATGRFLRAIIWGKGAGIGLDGQVGLTPIVWGSEELLSTAIHKKSGGYS